MSGDDVVKTFMDSSEYVLNFELAFPALTLVLAARPCPFYQQGSCFFSESCNFLHTVSATIVSEGSPPDDTTPAATPTNLPRVVVDSPSPSPVASLPSPRRSPDTTSVLLALRLIDDPDVTGNKSDATGQSDEESQDTLTEEITAWSESLPTLVNDGFSVVDEILPEGSYYTDDDTVDYAGNWTAISHYYDLSPNLSSQNIDQGVENLTSLVDGDSEEEDTVHAPVSSRLESGAQPSSVEVTQSDPSRVSVGLLSPIELSTLNLGPFRLDNNSVTEDANSDNADTWKPPNPLLPSPPRSPSISSTFDLLSSPFGILSSRVVSPYLGAFLARSPVSPARRIPPAMLDEIPPLDLGLGSPQENSPTSLLDNVDNKLYALSPSSPHNQDSADVSDSQVEDIRDELLMDYVGPDENLVREQVTAAIRRQSRNSPVHFLPADTNFDGDDALGHSSIDSIDVAVGSTCQLLEPAEEENDDSQLSLDPYTTAFLAYLRSPPQPMANDTLTSLYDIYSDIAPLKDIISDSIRNAGLSPPGVPAPTLSNSSPESSLLGRVFTPPPFGEKRSGTITADSPTPLSSPITSINSPSVGRSSPFSVQNDRRRPTGSTGRTSSRDEASKKVPFGFRQSFTQVSLILNLLQMRRDLPSQNRPTNSLLMSGRNLTRSVPSSPLKRHSEVPLPGAMSNPLGSPSSKGLKPLRLVKASGTSLT